MWGQRLFAQARQWLDEPPVKNAAAAPPPNSAVSEHALAQAVLAPHAACMRRIRAAYGYPDPTFEVHLLAPISALAAWLHFLPGPPGSGFEHPGGAIEQALTHCLFSLQAADGRSFHSQDGELPSADPGQRWRLACALGGLLASPREVLTRIEVASDEGELWPVAEVPLVQWLQRLPAPRYRYRWTSSGHKDPWLPVYVAARCIEPALMAFLSSGDGREPAGLWRCIGIADPSPNEPVSDVVSRVALAVAAREPVPGRIPPSSLLALTVKRLLGTTDWLPNAPGGHVWLALDGLYLLWPDVSHKILESMPRSVSRAGNLPSPEDLLNQLVASGAVASCPSPLHLIRVPGQSMPRQAVRVVDHERALHEAGIRASPIDLRSSAPEGRPAPSVEGLAAGQPIPAVSNGSTVRATSIAGDLLDMPPAGPGEEAGNGSSNSTVPEPSLPVLSLDTSKIANPRIRDQVDSVVSRLNQSFDGMLAKVLPTGVFVALTEFVEQEAQGAAIVRALHEAGLLAIDPASPARRVCSERMEGGDVAGVVLRVDAFQGYLNWLRCWQDDGQASTEPA